MFTWFPYQVLLVLYTHTEKRHFMLSDPHLREYESKLKIALYFVLFNVGFQILLPLQKSVQIKNVFFIMQTLCNS